MELHTFISSTLVQIAQGIENANKQLEGTRALVNPRNVHPVEGKGSSVYGYLNTKKKFYKVVQRIDFDVAVTAEAGTETKGGVGIQVGSIGIGTQGKSEKANSSVSRIAFSIPMVLPMDDSPFDKEDPQSE